MHAIHETKQHGTHAFPFIVYGGYIPDIMKSFPMHWHDEMEIIYVAEGKMTITIQNESFLVSRGEMVLIQPQMIHSLTQYENSPAIYFNILFRFSLLESNHKSPCYEKFFSPIIHQNRIIPKYIDINHRLNSVLGADVMRLYQLRNKEIPARELMIKATLFDLMYNLDSFCTDASPDEQYIKEIYEKLKNSLDFIQDHFSEQITVKDAAEISNFSASYFSKMFHQLMGISFTQYLISYRLEMAAELLKSNNDKISVIATQCGFNNLSYFTRAFDDKFGATPTRYRQTAVH